MKYTRIFDRIPTVVLYFALKLLRHIPGIRYTHLKDEEARRSWLIFIEEIFEICFSRKQFDMGNLTFLIFGPPLNFENFGNHFTHHGDYFTKIWKNM